MRRLLSGLVLSLGLLANTANADVSKMYFGAGLADGSVDITNGSEKSLGTLSVNVGIQVQEYVGVELALGAGSDDTGSIISDPLVSYQAILLRLGYRWDRIGLYALVGQARMDVDSAFNDSDSGAVVGLALNLFGNEKTALNLQVLDFDRGAFSSTTIGFQHYFGGFR